VKILMLFPGLLEDLPPLLTAAVCMRNLGAEVLVASLGCASETKRYLEQHKVECAHLQYPVYPQSPFGKAMVRPRFGRLAIRARSEFKPDVLWYHGLHSVPYSRLLKPSHSNRLVYHAHELNDGGDRAERAQNHFLSQIQLLLVPETNRAWILRARAQVNTDFMVIPNRPLDDVLPVESSGPFVAEKFRQCGGSPSCVRFIVYQGLLAPDRCVEAAVKAFSQLPDADVGFILMGKWADTSYQKRILDLIAGDRRIVLFPRMPAPDHLRVTSECVGGLILYAPNSLNHVYCAPNKLYEYALCGIGVVMPEFPGLAHLKEKFDLGELCDPLDAGSIAAAIARLLRRDPALARSSARNFLEADVKPADLYQSVYHKLF